MIYFADWGYLFFLLIIPVLVFWYFRKGQKAESSFKYSSINNLTELVGNGQKWKIYTLHSLKLLAIILFILALGRPQKGNTVKEFTSEGIDILLVLDISSSMKAVDFQPNRLEAAKNVARKFIEGRRDDRIGLVVFGGESFLQCPLTIDYDVLKMLLQQVEIIEQKFDGTAIGLAIASGINRLRESAAESKVMILLSDGRNNAGELDPLTTADMAKAFGIKIYTIGAGRRGRAPYPYVDPFGQKKHQLVDVEIDEQVLQSIAQNTGGKYFRATDEKSLFSIYKEISEMEKTEIKVKEFTNYTELYHYFLLPGILILLISTLLGFTLWRKTP